ncbi:MAG: phosphate acyltransferase PlsX [Mycoplasmataceae bacterium]|nr:phosphate acyltransferase PlsX [Mycoplasmataceae bacterium]
MKTIAFDMMGNDNGVRAGVEAVNEFVSKNINYNFILIGNIKEINKFTKESDRITMIDAKEINIKKGALAARKESNSMSIAINLVNEGKVDAVLSSGDSGSFLTLTTLILKRIKGVKRPAFMPVVPTVIKGQKFVLMDVGANLETSSEMLVQWSKLGQAFAKANLKITKPRVGIVNIGTEDKKGFPFHQEAAAILKKDKKVNYVGFVESRDLLEGVVDVAIVDGYAGNMILKSFEGSVLSLLRLLKSKLMSKTKYKLGALMAKGAFNDVKEQLDYRNVGAAWVMGLNGLAIKTHGSSDKKSYLGAFNQISLAIENNALDAVKKEFK